MFGLFARRAYLSYKKLSFLGLSGFVGEFLAWAIGGSTEGCEKPTKSGLRDGGMQLYISKVIFVNYT